MTGTVQPIVWMRALRDTPAKPPGTQLTVLLMLGLRMRKTGTGWAPIAKLAQDAGVGERTAMRAVQWAQDTGWIVRTRRGHRLNNEKSLASEYRLLLPPQPDTGVTLEGAESDRNPESQRDKRAFQYDKRGSQHDTGVTPRGPLASGLDTSVPPFGGSPNGDRVDDLEDLIYMDFSKPYELGKAIAAVANYTGDNPGSEEIIDLARTHFSYEDEREVFAAFHQHWDGVPF